jgi:PEP-CTERM motif
LRKAKSLLLFVSLFVAHSYAGSLVLNGSITQSTSDGTGPASLNPTLNSIQDAQSYTLTLNFAGSLPGSGTFDLTGSSLLFSVTDAPAVENNFSSISLTISPDGADQDFSLLACLAGADCATGNFLSASFSVPSGSLGLPNVPATGLDQPHPLDLLEDDGVTDIQGTITSYSAAFISPVPEPSSFFLAALTLAGAAIVFAARRP